MTAEPARGEAGADASEASQEIEEVQAGSEAPVPAPPDEFDEGMLKALDAAVRIAKLAKAGTTTGPAVDTLLEAVPPQWTRIDAKTGNRVIRPGMSNFLLEEWLPARVRAMAFQMLDENKRVALAERPRYSGREGLRDVAGLRASAAALAAKQAEVAKWKSAWAGEARQDKGYYDKVAEFQALRRAHGSRFPILLARGIDYGAVAEANDYDIHRLATGEAASVLGSIERTRQALGKGEIGAWDMGPVIDQVKQRYGIEPGSFADQLIERERKARAKSDKWKNIILAALQIGLTLAGALVGGGVGAVLVAGSATIGAEQGVSQLGEYGVKKAAAGSSIDPAQALSADDPSLIWLAVTVAGAMLDLGGTAKALEGAKGAFRAIAEAAKDLRQLRKLRKVALAEGKALQAEGLLKQGVSPRQFADDIVARAKVQRARSLGPATASAGSAPGPAAGIAASEAELAAEAAALAERLEPLRRELAGLRSTKARAQRLLDAVYESVDHIGLPKPRVDVLPIPPGGYWDHRRWTIAISQYDIGGQLTPRQFARLCDTMRHEVEHATQWFRMARVRHAEAGMSARQIAQELQMPAKFAKAAIKANKGRRAAEAIGQEVVTATKAHWESVFGAGRAARKATYAELDSATRGLRDAFGRRATAQDALASVRGELRTSPIYTAAQGQLINAERDLTYASIRFNNAHGAYRTLPEEAAAHAIGGKLDEAVRVRSVLEGARRAEYRAYERYWKLEQEVMQALGTSGTIPAKTQQAIDRALRDWYATVRRARNLEGRLGGAPAPGARAGGGTPAATAP